MLPAWRKRMEKINEEVLKLIAKRVKQASLAFYYRINGTVRIIDYGDIYSDAWETAIKAIETWDPDKGRKLESWIVFMIHRELKKNYYDFLPYEELNEEVCSCRKYPSPEQCIMTKQKFERMSPLSRWIFVSVFNGEIESRDDNKNSIKQAVKKECRNNGIAWNKIRAAFHELKQAAGE